MPYSEHDQVYHELQEKYRSLDRDPTDWPITAQIKPFDNLISDLHL